MVRRSPWTTRLRCHKTGSFWLSILVMALIAVYGAYIHDLLVLILSLMGIAVALHWSPSEPKLVERITNAEAVWIEHAHRIDQMAVAFAAAGFLFSIWVHNVLAAAVFLIVGIGYVLLWKKHISGKEKKSA